MAHRLNNIKQWLFSSVVVLNEEEHEQINTPLHNALDETLRPDVRAQNVELAINTYIGFAKNKSTKAVQTLRETLGKEQNWEPIQAVNAIVEELEPLSIDDKMTAEKKVVTADRTITSIHNALKEIRNVMRGIEEWDETSAKG